MLLVGSRALKLHAPNLLRRQPKDFDFIAYRDEAETWFQSNDLSFVEIDSKLISRNEADPSAPIVEFELADNKPSSQALIELVRKDTKTRDLGKFGLLPSIEVLFALKKSHRFLRNSPHFWKTANGYHAMKAVGIDKLLDVDVDLTAWVKLREKETYNYKHPSLMQDKQAFFSGDQVKYVYDHDSIHRAVAIFDAPAYTFFQRDGAQVQVDRSKWEGLDHSVKLASVIEEACVLAIERSLVPFPGVKTPLQAWQFALSKVCSSITSGFWREFAYENLFQILSIGSGDYYERFLVGVESGLVVRVEA